MELIIGPRLYSTWSLRPWLVLKRCKADFTVREIDIYTPEGKAELEKVSPSRLVPLLKVDGETIWDSMAISVWCAENFPNVRLWPADAHARWLARSAACEMHGGFMGLRTECGMGPDHTMVGEWSVPDAFFTPVAARFRHFQIDLAAYGDDGTAAAYRDVLLAQPDFLEWSAEALSGH